MRQDAYLFANSPDDDYIILRYRIRNDSGGNITGLRVGWYQDWDIGDATDAEAALGDLLLHAPIPSTELAENSGLFVSPRTLKRQFFFDEVYKHALGVDGLVM